MNIHALEAVRRRYLPATRGVVRFIQFFSSARARLFGFIFGLATDGVTAFTAESSGAEVRPLGSKVPLPEGPLIIVANHRSHADSAVLISMIGRQRPLLVVADAGYWLADAATELIARGLIGIWPIRRESENARGDLMLAAELVSAGVVLVVFPEGHRSRDGQLGQVHTGAFRLAQATGASILPASLIGTERLMPAEGTKLARHSVNVRFGEPFTVAADDSAVDKAVAKTEAEFLNQLKKPLEVHPGRGWQRAHKIALSWVGIAVVFLWALGEGTVWPFIAEMPLLLLVGSVGKNWRALWLIVASAFGSALGILVSWYFISNGIEFWMPLTTSHMYTFANLALRHDLTGAFWGQMWNGIPVKVYAHEAGALHLSFTQVLAAIFPRMLRVIIVGAGGWLAGLASRRWIQSCLGIVQLSSLILFPLGLAIALNYWSVTR